MLSGPFPPGTARTPLSDLQNGGVASKARVGARGVSARISNGLLVSGDARRPLTAGAHLKSQGAKPRRGVSAHAAQPHAAPPSFLSVEGVSNSRGAKLVKPGAVLDSGLDSGDADSPVGGADVCDELMRILEHRAQGIPTQARLPADGAKRAGVQYSAPPPHEDSEAPGEKNKAIAGGGANGRELLKGRLASGERRASRERGGGSAGQLRGGMFLTADSAARESVRASGAAGAGAAAGGGAGGGAGVRASSGGGLASGKAIIAKKLSHLHNIYTSNGYPLHPTP